MRNLSPNIQAVAATYNFEFIVVGEIAFAVDPVRFTSYYDDVMFDGKQFPAENNLIAIDPPRLSSVVDREIFKIVFDDTDRSLRARMETGMSGVGVSVWAVFHNTTGAILGPYLPNELMTDKQDVVCVYDGIIDTYGMTSNDSQRITIECSAPTAGLGLVKAYFTSKAFGKRYYPDDTTYDAVYSGSQQVELLWGRAR